MEFRPLKASEIDVRVGQVTKKGAILLLYKNARADMNILDETVGAENWQREHYEVKGNMFCRVGIYAGQAQEEDGVSRPVWVWKSDCGVESNTEKEKGESSDSFKRACFNWGIGRELYTAPLIFIPCETVQDGNKYKLKDMNQFYGVSAKNVTYTETKEIETLTIINRKGEVIFKK